MFHKILRYSTVIFLLSSFPHFSQIDTTVYFPTKPGNFWEYWGTVWGDWVKLTIESTKDTVLSNGKTYQKMETLYYQDSLSVEHLWDDYLRYEPGKVYRYYNDDSCSDFEYIAYDFNVPDSTIWLICPLYFSTHRGVSHTRYYNSFQMTFEVKLYDYVNVDGQDTIWAPMGSPTSERIAKGLGMINQLRWDWMLIELYGARINGQVYGTLTSVESNFTPVNTFQLYQNYPNPFNPATKIKYSIPQASMVQVKVFNILGEEIETLINEEKPAGVYEITWSAADLSSGVYFYQLKSGSFIETKKMVLLR